MTEPKSLAMIKMEKNFRAHNDKNYPRQPYNEYPLFSDDYLNLGAFVEREMEELTTALKILKSHSLNYARLKGEVSTLLMIRQQAHEAMLEVGDVSNTLDYLFEGLLRVYTGGTD